MSEAKVNWIKTDKHVYFAIYREHKDSLTVFGAITDGDGLYGSPLIMTEWGFKTANIPLIRAESRPQADGAQTHEYFIAHVENGDDE